MMKPGTKAPSLDVFTVSGEKWSIQNPNDDSKFSLILFYRGLHCPICEKQLKSLSSLHKNFEEQGVGRIIAVSGDTKEKAEKAFKDWDLGNLEVGYGQSLKSMAEWGLFLSESVKDPEPKYFGEPGMFLVDRDKKLFYCSTTSMPFARPRLEDLLEGLKHINDGYPRRGTVSYTKIPEIEAGGDTKDLVDWRSEMEMIDNHVVVSPTEEQTKPSLKD